MSESAHRLKMKRVQECFLEIRHSEIIRDEAKVAVDMAEHDILNKAEALALTVGGADMPFDQSWCVIVPEGILEIHRHRPPAHRQYMFTVTLKKQQP